MGPSWNRYSSGLEASPGELSGKVMRSSTGTGSFVTLVTVPLEQLLLPSGHEVPTG